MFRVKQNCFLFIHCGTLLRLKQKHGERYREINPGAALLDFTIPLSRLKLQPFVNILIYL